MANHDEACQASQRLCDKLIDLLIERDTTITRYQTNNSCGFLQSAGTRFAYVYHRKEIERITIYIRGEYSDELNGNEYNIPLQRRTKQTGSWEKRFPYYAQVDSVDEVERLAELVMSVAHPHGVRKIGSQNIAARPPYIPAEELLPRAEYVEGAVRSVRVNAYERNSRARKTCLKYHGTACSICGFDFGKAYGPELIGFIHVHHLKQLSTVRQKYKVDPINDLLPVCPNCHAVLHRREPPYSVEEVRKMLHVTK